MFLTTLLLAAQPAAPAAFGSPMRPFCAPAQNLSAAGPPPPVFQAQRMEIAPESRIYLSVQDCPRPGGGYRVERRLSRGDRDVGDLEWVPVAQCPALGAWVQAATRLQLPAPMLRPRQDNAGPARGTWFTLNAHRTAGAGSISGLELQILEPPGATPNALSAWFRAGEQVFRTCRDQGRGGTGYLPGHVFGR